MIPKLDELTRRAHGVVAHSYRRFARLLVWILALVVVVYLSVSAALFLIADSTRASRAQALFAVIESVVTTLALILGAVWGYYRFVRSRTFVRRLKPEVHASRLAENSDVLVIDAGISNLSSVTVPLSAAYVLLSEIDLNRPAGPTESEAVPAQRLDVLTYLGRTHARYTLEPGEEMHRQIVARATPTFDCGVRIDLIVESGQQRCWSATTHLAAPS